MKKTITIASLIATAGMVNAATLLTSNFDGNDATTDPSKATGLTWTTDADVTMNSSGDLTAYGANFGVFGSNSNVNNITSATNLNTNRPTERGYSVDFTTTSAFDLTTLSIDSRHLNNTGGTQVFSSDLYYTIEGINGTVGTISGFVDDISYVHGGYTTTPITLTGESLAVGEYRVSVGMRDMIGGGAFAAFDGVTLEGTAVPEPTSTALLGLGGLALIMRRRK